MGAETATASLSETPMQQTAEPASSSIDQIAKNSTTRPRKVQVQMLIKRLHDLDTVMQTFGAQLGISMMWQCPSSEEPPPPEEDDGDWVPKWTPKYRIKSLVEERLK